MTQYVVRGDPVDFTGRVVGFVPPLATLPAAALSDWTIAVKPDKHAAALLVTQAGTANFDGLIHCSVAVRETSAGYGELAAFFAGTVGCKVRVIGTWCDTGFPAMTVIRPLGLLAVVHPISTVDIGGWPVAIRDLKVVAFAHAASPLSGEPHAGASRVFAPTFALPLRPSDIARPFARAYAPTIVDRAARVDLAIVDGAATAAVRVTIDTGTPAAGRGYYRAQIGLAWDEPELDQFCPPGSCDLDGKHCSFEGGFRYTRLPEHLPIARKGDLALGPGDGVGLVSGIVASLRPPQVYDHMGIFVDNGWRIRHCTASADRLEDESLFPVEVPLVGLKLPLTGFRADLVRYGWPGSITQTVEEVYRTGRNTLNARWSFVAKHPGTDTDDPERPGVALRLYHLPRDARALRLGFHDPERAVPERLVRLQDAPVRLGQPVVVHQPQLVRPHWSIDAAARPVCEQVADLALRLDAHYRFFAYTRGDIGLDPARNAPAADDPAWRGLPAGARWAAGTIGAMCSSFVWTAVRLVERMRAAGQPRLVLEDRREPEDANVGREYGAVDGLYRYTEEERRNAAAELVRKLTAQVRATFDARLPRLVQDVSGVGALREGTAQAVANQIANTFAFDAPERIDPAWEKPGPGETASPDNVRDFWDLRPVHNERVQPEGGLALYGESVPIQLAPPAWLRVPMFRKHDDDRGSGQASGQVRVGGQPMPGATLRFDYGCASITTTDRREQATWVKLGAGKHFADAFALLPNPASGAMETWRTPQPAQFDLARDGFFFVTVDLVPPPELWRILDVAIEADIADRSFWGGNADQGVRKHVWSMELRQDLTDDPNAAEDERNTLLEDEQVWTTRPQVGSGVHVAVGIKATLDPASRAIGCEVRVALIDTDDGGFLGIGTSSDLEDLVERKVLVAADTTETVLADHDLASSDTVPEYARVTLRITNRRRPA